MHGRPDQQVDNVVRTKAWIVVVRSFPENGNKLDEEEDAGIDGGDDAQHLKTEKEQKPIKDKNLDSP